MCLSNCSDQVALCSIGIISQSLCPFGSCVVLLRYSTWKFARYGDDKSSDNRSLKHLLCFEVCQLTDYVWACVYLSCCNIYIAVCYRSL